MIGQPWPVAYPGYNVPYAYQDTYYDTPEWQYRYANNSIYRVDPKTLAVSPWFDAPGEYSHEYFPKLDNSGLVLVYGASTGGHEHDTADYEIFLWPIMRPAAEAVRLTYHTGNDCWPDIYLADNKQ